MGGSISVGLKIGSGGRSDSGISFSHQSSGCRHNNSFNYQSSGCRHNSGATQQRNQPGMSHPLFGNPEGMTTFADMADRMSLTLDGAYAQPQFNERVWCTKTYSEPLGSGSFESSSGPLHRFTDIHTDQGNVYRSERLGYSRQGDYGGVTWQRVPLSDTRSDRARCDDVSFRHRGSPAIMHHTAAQVHGRSEYNVMSNNCRHYSESLGGPPVWSFASHDRRDNYDHHPSRIFKQLPRHF